MWCVARWVWRVLVGAVWRPYVRVVREVCGHVSSCGWDQKVQLAGLNLYTPTPPQCLGTWGGVVTGGRVRRALRERR